MLLTETDYMYVLSAEDNMTPKNTLKLEKPKLRVHCVMGSTLLIIKGMKFRSTK